MLVSADLLAVLHARYENKLSVGGALIRTLNIWVSWLITWLEGVQVALNHMVPIDMRRQLKNVLVEFFDHLPTMRLHIFDVCSHRIHKRLHGSGPVNTQTDSSGLRQNWVNDYDKVCWLSNLNNLLT